MAPVLVVPGSLIGHPLDLLFDTFEVAGVVIAVSLANLLNSGIAVWAGWRYHQGEKSHSFRGAISARALPG